MNELLPAAVGAIVRAALQLAAGAGVVLAPNLEAQLSAGALALITLAWSMYQKKKAAAQAAKDLAAAKKKKK